MKKAAHIFFISLIVLAAGCNSATNETEEVIEEPMTESTAPGVTENEMGTVHTTPPLWTIEYESSTQTEKLKKTGNAPSEAPTVESSIKALNDYYDGVQLQFDKISHDTIFVNIPDSKKLTQQMGSTGAYNYMASAVYNLTEDSKIKYVKFNFAPGDHSTPGVYTREDFKALR